MAKLKAVLESLDDVPDALKDLYVEQGGKFVLDADGVEDVSGLKSALERERRARREAERKVPSDFDPDRYADLLAREEEFTKGKLTDKQREEFDSLKRQLQEANQKELTKRDGRIKSLESALHRELIVSRATQAIAAAKGRVKVLLPHIERQAAVIESDGGYAPVVMGQDGHARVNNEGKNMTFDDLVAEMRGDPEFAANFEGTGSNGGGATRSAAGGGGGATVVAAGDDRAFLANLEGIAAGKVTVK